MNYSVMILAAGSGTRCNLGYNKLLFKLEDGLSIIEKTVSVFENEKNCTQIILVVSENDETVMRNLFKARVEYVLGGQSRQESSLNGLKHVKEDVVMIHDGARPYVSKEELHACEEAMEENDAALLMVPVKDTIKVVKDGYVVSTPNRADLMAALTPQCFKTTLIKEAIEKAQKEGILFSDDASAVELCTDKKVKVIMGSYANQKITTIEDLK